MHCGLYLHSDSLKMKKSDLLFLIGSTLVLAALRLIIPIPNFSPIGAIALTGGLVLGKRKLTYLLPFAGLFASDLLLSFLSKANSEYLFSNSFAIVYIAFGITIFMGILANRKNIVNPIATIPYAIAASVIFFLLTNFGSWIYDSIYTKDINGLITCYLAGLAFYKQDFFGNMALNHLMATVFFSFIFTWAWNKSQQFLVEPVPAK